MSARPQVLFVLVGETPLCESLRARLRAGGAAGQKVPGAPACLLVRAEDLAKIDSDLEEWMHATAETIEALLSRYSQLTPRERQTLPLVTEGMLNKQAASLLGISEATVQIHRGRIMQKMGARSFAELVRIAALLGIVHESGRDEGACASWRPLRARTLQQCFLIESAV